MLESFSVQTDMANRQQVREIRICWYRQRDMRPAKRFRRAQGATHAAFSAAVSTIRTTSAMMRFNSKSFGV